MTHIKTSKMNCKWWITIYKASLPKGKREPTAALIALNTKCDVYLMSSAIIVDIRIKSAATYNTTFAAMLPSGARGRRTWAGVVHLNLTVTWPIMRSARAVVARAPPEILDPSDFGANTNAMGKWCIFVSFSSHIFTLKIFSKILADSCVELIGL